MLKSFLAKALGIKPIIAVNKEGKAYLMDKTLTQKGNMKRVVKHLKVLVKNKNVLHYVVLHANSLRVPIGLPGKCGKYQSRNP